MHSAVEMQERVRPYACALVDHHRHRTGSRMTAYVHVADAIGVSTSWVRRLIGRQPIGLAAHEYLNLLAAYTSLCERIEQQAEHERMLTRALKGQADEAIQSALGMARRVSRQEESGAEKAP